MLSRTKAPFLSERLNLIVPRVSFGECLSTALCLATYCLGAFRELLSLSKESICGHEYKGGSSLDSLRS